MDLICRNQDLEDALPDVSISLAWLARMLSPMFSLVIMPKMDACLGGSQPGTRQRALVLLCAALGGAPRAA